MWEVYEDGSYLEHFQTEKEAREFCEERNWEYEDPDFGYVSDLSCHEVDRLDEARTFEGNDEAVAIDGKIYEPTGYRVVYDRKWHYEFIVDGKREYLAAARYAELKKEKCERREAACQGTT